MKSSLLLLTALLLSGPVAAQPAGLLFTIAQLHYGGGGDWYEDRTSLINLLKGVRQRTSIPVGGDREAIVEPGAAAVLAIEPCLQWHAAGY